MWHKCHEICIMNNNEQILINIHVMSTITNFNYIHVVIYNNGIMIWRG